MSAAQEEPINEEARIEKIRQAALASMNATPVPTPPLMQSASDDPAIRPEAKKSKNPFKDDRLLDAIRDLRRLGLTFVEIQTQSKCDVRFLAAMFSQLDIPHPVIAKSPPQSNARISAPPVSLNSNSSMASARTASVLNDPPKQPPLPGPSTPPIISTKPVSKRRKFGDDTWSHKLRVTISDESSSDDDNNDGYGPLKHKPVSQIPGQTSTSFPHSSQRNPSMEEIPIRNSSDVAGVASKTPHSTMDREGMSSKLEKLKNLHDGINKQLDDIKKERSGITRKLIEYNNLDATVESLKQQLKEKLALKSEYEMDRIELASTLERTKTRRQELELSLQEVRVALEELTKTLDNDRQETTENTNSKIPAAMEIARPNSDSLSEMARQSPAAPPVPQTEPAEKSPSTPSERKGSIASAIEPAEPPAPSVSQSPSDVKEITVIEISDSESEEDREPEQNIHDIPDLEVNDAKGPILHDLNDTKGPISHDLNDNKGPTGHELHDTKGPTDQEDGPVDINSNSNEETDSIQQTEQDEKAFEFKKKFMDMDMEQPMPYQEYQSPLKAFRSFKFSPLFSEQVSSGYRSLAYNGKIPLNMDFCSTELKGKDCHNKDCKDLHFRNIVTDDQSILGELSRAFVGETAEEVEAYKSALVQLIQNSEGADFDTMVHALINFRQHYAGKSGRILDWHKLKSVALRKPKDGGSGELSPSD